MSKATFHQEFSSLIRDPFFANEGSGLGWARYIINNIHLLSNESIEYAASVQGHSECHWSPDVLEAFERVLEERTIEKILLS